MILSKLYYRCMLGDHDAQPATFSASHWVPCDPSVTTPDDSTEIVCQIEGSEALHLSLEQNQNFHTMSLLVSGTPPSCVGRAFRH